MSASAGSFCIDGRSKAWINEGGKIREVEIRKLKRGDRVMDGNGRFSEGGKKFAVSLLFYVL